MWRDPAFATSGSFPAIDSWATDRSVKDAPQLARKAIESLGAEAVQVDANCVYGWVGMRITIARLAEYQLLVLIEDDPQGLTIVTCSVRPGYRRLLGSRGFSREWLRRLRRDPRA